MTSMNPTKFIIYIIIIIIIKILPTLAFKNSHQVFPTVDLKKLPNHPIHCSCYKNELLLEMAAVKFKDGNKYLISAKPIGQGGTAMVFHAIYIGKKWEMKANAPTDCVAIKVADELEEIENNKKVANQMNIENNKRIEKELTILNDIFQQYDQSATTLPLPAPSHILSFLRKEIFSVKIQYKLFKKHEHFAIVMELGEQNLYKYWDKAMLKYSNTYDKVSETIFFYILREITISLHQLNRRNYIFIDLKPENLMVMPNSPYPNPKELFDKNFRRIRIKLTDFGAAQKFDQKSGKRTLSENDRDSLTCSFFYRAPELYISIPTNDAISPKTDIYSLGRLMLILIVQTPQIKKFWKELNEKFVENYENWRKLVDDMLAAVGLHPLIPPSNVEEISDQESPQNIEETSDHGSQQLNAEEISEYESNSDVEIDNEIVERKKKEKEEMEMKEIEKEVEDDKETKKKLYKEIKRNYGHLMEIIERTQAKKQEERPTARDLIAECFPKLAHLRRSQSERKSNKDSPTRKFFYSGALIARNLEANASGSSTSRGSIFKSVRKGISKRFSSKRFSFLN